ncbi:MAG: 4Fe-4S dicluster domain-containing protein, partial [Ktedonobacteraceae bacterium]|nr:4Fe-4S dicluster domain-containing protein [Ktedonobacteraceae bacterium]
MAIETGRSQDSPLQGFIEETLISLRKEPPPPSQPAMGFFTDTSLCIGCKACEVACKQWNQLPATEPKWSGTSYDNTSQLGATTWRHVQFIEQIGRAPRSTKITPLKGQSDGVIGGALPFFNSDRWLMHSDVCKHCANAPCQEVCPTGAIIRTEFDTVYVQQDICNGCGYCVTACPFGVIARDELIDQTAHKCTLCYDRLKDGIEPACAKACPTDSIVFGEVEQLKAKARERLGFLQQRGVSKAQLYGVDDKVLDDGLNSFFLLLDEPEVYNLPRNPARPVKNVAPASFWTILAAMLLGIIGILCF